MTRSEFLNALYRRLSGMSREEAEQYLTYYAEMLADRMEEGMTEEEAVASMEDVDAIAQRILQDRADEQAAAVQPPRAPDIPRTPVTEPVGEGPGEEPPAKPVRGRPRWLLPAAIAAAVLLLLAVSPGPIISINNEGVRIGSFYCGPEGLRLGGLMTIDNDGIRIGPDSGDGTFAVTEEPDWSISQDQVTAVEGVAVVGDYNGMYEVPALGITEIEIQWVGGDVFVEEGAGSSITFSETSAEDLNEKTRLYYEVEGSTLKIRYTEKEQRPYRGEKQLFVTVPATQAGDLEELEIETVSAGIFVNGVGAGKLSLETVSGDCTVVGSYYEVSVETVSGSVTVEGEIRVLDAESNSGYLYLAGSRVLEELKVGTVSGDVDVLLEPAGFTLLWETVSGQLNSTFNMTRSGQRYVYGSGGCRIEAETTSGDLNLMEY